MNAHNIILTGIKRSGTTLACHLLNKAPDVVALHEPMHVSKLAELENRGDIGAPIERFFAETRASIRLHGKAVSKNKGGQVPKNTYGSQYTEEGTRKNIGMKRSQIAIEKSVSDDFVLCVKHPAAFTAILEILIKRFPCFAIIRNPLSILASWNSVNMPLTTGHMPAAERLDYDLKKTLKHAKDRFDRQIQLLAWHYEKYRRVLPSPAILRYEDMITSGGKCLAAITPNADTLNEALVSKNKNELYDAKLMRVLSEKLLSTDGAFWEFYSKESVEALLN